MMKKRKYRGIRSTSFGRPLDKNGNPKPPSSVPKYTVACTGAASGWTADDAYEKAWSYCRHRHQSLEAAEACLRKLVKQHPTYDLRIAKMIGHEYCEAETDEITPSWQPWLPPTA